MSNLALLDTIIKSENTATLSEKINEFRPVFISLQLRTQIGPIGQEVQLGVELPTSSYQDFLWTVCKYINTNKSHLNEIAKIRTFLYGCETGDYGPPITGIFRIMNKSGANKMYKRYLDYLKTYTFFNSNPSRVLHEDESLDLCNMVLIFMIEDQEQQLPTHRRSLHVSRHRTSRSRSPHRKGGVRKTKKQKNNATKYVL